MHIRPLLCSLLLPLSLAAQNDLTLQLDLDRYGAETTWQFRNSNNQVLYSGGPYTTVATNGVYPQPPILFSNLPDGQYSFNIFDSANDGICCAYGNGSFTVTHDQSGIVLASGGSFGGQSLNTFMVPPPMGVPTPLAIELVQWGTGFSEPVDIAHMGDDRLFIVERQGFIRIMTDSMTTLPTPFLSIQSRVYSTGSERGLLGLTFDPDYANNGRFYVCYTATGGTAGISRVSRFTVTADPNVADDTSEEILYTWPQPFSNHNGGDLDFGPDGYLYVGFGDGGSANDPQGRAQDLSNPLGDMIRIDVSGATGYSVPSDNPWVGTTDTLPEIWASGLRNPWRFGFDRTTGDLWIGDVGQDAFEEVDIWPAGNNSGPNFGWRCYEGFNSHLTNGCLGASAYEEPVAVHGHTTDNWCSVIGGRVYRGASYTRLMGRYIYADYCAGDFYSLLPDGNGGWSKEKVLDGVPFGTSCIAEDNVGEMYVANTSNGRIYKITDPCPMAAPVITISGADIVSSPAAEHFWFIDGVLDTAATGATYTPTASGNVNVVADMGNGCLLSSDTVLFLFNALVEVGGIGELEVSPNPVSERLAIDLPKDRRSGRCVLLDGSGRVVMSHSVMNSQRAFLDVSGLADGSYLLQLFDVTGTLSHAARVIVVH